nr:MAG TPA: hypothetical protein [Caudoviricetes sp.]
MSGNLIFFFFSNNHFLLCVYLEQIYSWLNP